MSCVKIGSTQTPKPTRFLWVSLRSLYHKKLSGLGAGEPGVRAEVQAPIMHLQNIKKADPKKSNEKNPT